MPAGDPLTVVSVRADSGFFAGVAPNTAFVGHLRQDQDAATPLRVENATVGGSAIARFEVKSDIGVAAYFGATSSGFTGPADWAASVVVTSRSSAYTGGLILHGSTKVRIQNTAGTDVVRVDGGSTTFLGNVALENNVRLQWKDTGGGSRICMILNGSDQLLVGPASGSIPIIFQPGASEAMRLTSAGILLVGTTVTSSALAGDLVLPNNRWLRAVNGAGTDTKPVIGLSATSDIIQIGTVAIAASVPANFTADKYLRWEGPAGENYYVPVRNSAW